MDNIIEIYNFPETLETKDLMSIFSEYREKGVFIKWVNKTHALGVFSCSTEAERALSMSYSQCSVRPLSTACGSCQLKASQLEGLSLRGRGRGRSRGRGNLKRGGRQSSGHLASLSSDDEDTPQEFQLPIYGGDDDVDAFSGNKEFHQPANDQDQTSRKQNTKFNRNDLSVRGRGRSSNKSGTRMQSQISSRISMSTNPFLNEHAHSTLETNPRGNQRGPRMRKMGYMKLKELAESARDPDNLLLEIVTPQSGFSDLLKEKLRQDLMYYVIEILVQSFKSPKRQTVHDLVQILTSRNFVLINLSVFIGDIDIGNTRYEGQELGSLIKNICSLSGTLLKYMQSDLSILNILIDSVERLTSKNMKCNEIIQHFCPEIMEMVTEMKEARDRIKEKLIKRADDEDKRMPKESCETVLPPDDFRSLDILPTLKDIYFNEKPFLRVNKTKGNYHDLNHYLDVQFRLLREDYLQPLRQGIISYRKNLECGKKAEKLQDIRVYENVQILMPVCKMNGILHIIQFDTSKLQNVRWESSQRLMFGSLLCLSRDGFENIFFATVTNRKLQELKEGRLEVRFQNLEMIADFRPSDVFVMAETTAYFEAYRHVVKGLQEIQDDMPFQKYIVHCQASTKPPKYLLRSGTVLSFNFSPLLSCTTESEVPVLNTSKWPSAEDLKVDDSQYKAIQMAITKEMAIIQGPPGTGKTFVGLKIVKLLLHNKEVWTTEKAKDPILVVCYTNHALDQFLQEISRYTKKLVRVGGQSNNEEMKKYTLQKFREEARAEKTVSKTVHERKHDCKVRMAESREKIESVSEKIKIAKMGILKLGELRPCISDQHMDSLMLYESRNCFDEWLGFNQDHSNVISLDEKENEKIMETMNRWLNELLSGTSITIMSLERVDEIGEFWGLNLYERASLYKRLLFEFRNAAKQKMQKKAQKFNDFCQIARDKKRLYEIEVQIHAILELLQTSNQEITPVNVLKIYITNDKVRKAAERLHAQIPLFSKFCEWLCLDGSFSSVERVSQSLEGKTEEIQEEIFEDGERHLDEYEEDETDFQHSKKGKENSLQLQFSNLSTTSISILNESEIRSEQQSSWRTQMRSSRLKKALKQAINGEALTEAESNEVSDIWTLSYDKRRKLYRFWLNSYISIQKKSIEEEVKKYSDVCTSYNEVLDAENVDIMTGADVIGMTTTGAAKNRTILQKIKPKIIVVEEAAEVLESHVVTAINPKCEHLILIGDHKQLRPTPTVYMLAKKYNLDISLFERMVNNKLNYTTLGQQHRMRPEISVLMKHIYPNLNDHPCVQTYESIKGIDSNVYFINHQQMETSHSETKSHSNLHEANFVSRLCKYILQQGYEPTQVTILTAYTGQVLALKRKMPKPEFQGVKITSVDNFQGEENDIIVLSLVRSNKNQSTGFLKIDNRICVALSRARKGMYVIGNFELLQSQSTLWQDIINTMKNQQKFGSSLTLRCQNHPLKTFNVAEDFDFDAMPNGGCREICNGLLHCGHKCEQFCHIADASHDLYQCMKQCEKSCSFGHQCSKKCFQECGKCSTLVIKTNPYCGHDNTLPCSEGILNWKCPQPCNCLLPCKHFCEGTCYDCKKNKTHSVCTKKCEKMLLCGHLVKAECFKAVEFIRCTKKCNEKLSCGHFCSGTCTDCHHGRLHVVCEEKCQHQLICGHKCSQFCRDGCPPCEMKCMTRCSHQQCKKKCKEICEVCTKPCERKCLHQECDKKCHESCLTSACTENCSKVLKCDHNCSGYCSEPCPAFCKVCDSDKISSNLNFDMKFIQVLKLDGCGHEFESTTFDRHIFYNHMSSDSLPVGTCLCPTCLRVVGNNERYMDVVKWARRRIDMVKRSLQQDQQQMNEKKNKIVDSLLSFRDIDKEAVKDITFLIEDEQCTTNNICLAELQLAILKLLYAIFERMSNSVLADTKEEKSIGEELINVRDITFQRHFRRNDKRKKEKRKCFSKQEIDDIKCELKRLAYHVNFLLFCDKDEINKEIIDDKHGDVLKSFHGRKKIDNTTLQTLHSLASEYNWIMYERNFDEIDNLFTNMDRKITVWRYGTWFRCKRGHLSQTIKDRDKCSSCGYDIGMDVHMYGKPEIPNALNNNSVNDETHDGQWSTQKNKKKRNPRKGKSDTEMKNSLTASTRPESKNVVATKQTASSLDVARETNISLKVDEMIKLENTAQEKLAVVKCNKGHIMMRNESDCRWCKGLLDQKGDGSKSIDPSEESAEESRTRFTPTDKTLSSEYETAV